MGILCRQNAEQRGFARAVASDEAIDLAWLDGQRDAVQHLFFVVAFDHIRGLQYSVRHVPVPPLRFVRRGLFNHGHQLFLADGKGARLVHKAPHICFKKTVFALLDDFLFAARRN